MSPHRPGESRELADSPWPGLPPHPVLLIPVGSTEQHGPHLPLDVDTTIATEVCRRAAADAAQDVRVAPAIAYGSSGEHQDFPGTLSIGSAVLESVLIELGRSARTWASRVVFVNGHGGNAPVLERAVALLRYEGDHVAWIACRHGAGHAGRAETSIMLRLDPERVRVDDAVAGPDEDLRALMPRLRSEGVRAVSPGGVLGDPAGATADEGERLLTRMAEDVRRMLENTDA